MFKYLSATSPMIVFAIEQAGPRIISLVGCDGSVCWIRWYAAGIDEHWLRKTCGDNLLIKHYREIFG